MDTSDGISNEYGALAERSEEAGASTINSANGLHAIVAVLVALWYCFTAGSAMSRGFVFLYEGSKNDYPLAQALMWISGLGIGIALAVCLARSARLKVGIISSVMMCGLLLSLLFIIQGYELPEQVSVFGYSPSAKQYVVGVAILTLLSGFVGTAGGIALRADKALGDILLGIHYKHWWWLWIAFWAWVSILPTAIYYVWLELVSTVYVVVHPSLWLSRAWTAGWTMTFGFAGFAALFYGIALSLGILSSTNTTVPKWKRVLLFMLGTLVLAGPVANILFSIAIHSLKHLPDGITADPWWVLR